MTKQIELHGKVECPFAWRTRLSAFEKGVSFDYIAFDTPSPDPRSARHNPDQHSPLLVHGDFQLTESSVIAQYIDEVFEGRPLVPRTAVERARMRVDSAELGELETEIHAGEVVTPQTRARLLACYGLLERKLADGRDWLGGGLPLLSDLLLWPHLIGLQRRVGVPVPEGHGLVAAYLARVLTRESVQQTRPH
ncbi:MAG: glutathione S-transferase family protein [Deltaproteobacteria bacterium]